MKKWIQYTLGISLSATGVFVLILILLLMGFPIFRWIGYLGFPRTGFLTQDSHAIPYLYRICSSVSSNEKILTRDTPHGDGWTFELFTFNGERIKEETDWAITDEDLSKYVKNCRMTTSWYFSRFVK